MSKDIIKQTASELFASTAHDVLWSNLKGEFFTSENIGGLSLKTGQKLTKHERTEGDKKEVTSDKKEAPLNANDVIAKIKAVESLEALKEFETDERKSVKSVYDWKVKVLTDAINVIDSQNVSNGNKDTEDKSKI